MPPCFFLSEIKQKYYLDFRLLNMAQINKVFSYLRSKCQSLPTCDTKAESQTMVENW